MLPQQLTKSDISQETWPIARPLMSKRPKKEECENEVVDQCVVPHVSSSNKMSLQDVARGRVDVIFERMQHTPDDYIDVLKSHIRVILEGNGGSHQREEFLALQKLVQSRFDLSFENLARAHHALLEILVAINIGIQAFLHPSISLSQTSLIEVFLYKRYRNIACQSQLPGDDCTCETCRTRKGFCNFCMFVICNKFDFELNTCRWIGCDMFSHWTHTDCANHDGLIFMGASRPGLGRPKMLFRCRACNKTSELLGWVKDVFLNCMRSWNKEALAKELDYVCRIFRGSEDLGGRKLFWKCEDLIEKLKEGCVESMVSKAIHVFFQELELETSKKADKEESGQQLAPQEACGRIDDVVHEA
ncbi:hypothetical protein V2J09_005966 [Rumex salicifolius]